MSAAEWYSVTVSTLAFVLALLPWIAIHQEGGEQ
jgi:hypothetical protein